MFGFQDETLQAWRREKKGPKGTKLGRTIYTSVEVLPEYFQQRPNEQPIAQWPYGVKWKIHGLTNELRDMKICNFHGSHRGKHTGWTSKDKEGKKVRVSKVMRRNKSYSFTILHSLEDGKDPKAVGSVALRNHQDDEGIERACEFILTKAKQ